MLVGTSVKGPGKWHIEPSWRAEGIPARNLVPCQATFGRCQLVSYRAKTA
jgi:hypothetical protein